MTLLDSELARVKHELGFNALSVGAEPTVSISRYFEQIVVPNLQAGALTSSATAVTAATSGATPVTLTLTSATGFALLNRVVVDVDDLQESATVRSVSGSTINVALSLAHSGTYPVTVEGGESIVRDYLRKCVKVSGLIERFGSRAGIKSIDKADVEFFGGANEKAGLRTLEDVQKHMRHQLCMLLFGCGNITAFGGAGGRMSVY